METVTSKDDTTIAFDRMGQGPAVILVGGALSVRSSTLATKLPDYLSQHFTVIAYDRRGRGDSGDTPPYAVEREVEDIEVLIDDAGGAAFVYGMSSGAVLALEAANRIAERWASVIAPTLVITGGNSEAFFHKGAQALVDSLAIAKHRVLDGQNHAVSPAALAPVLIEFFNA